MSETIEMRCEVCGHVYDPNPTGARPITCEHGKYRGTVTFTSGAPPSPGTADPQARIASLEARLRAADERERGLREALQWIARFCSVKMARVARREAEHALKTYPALATASGEGHQG